MGSTDQSTRHLSASGSFIKESLGQGQWSTLGLSHVIDRNTLGTTELGVAISDCVSAIRALLCGVETVSQVVVGLGSADGLSASTMAAGTSGRTRRGPHLYDTRVSTCLSNSCPSSCGDYTLASSPLHTETEREEGSTGSQTQEGRPFANATSLHRPSTHSLAIGDRSLIWRRLSHARNRNGTFRLVPCGQARRAYPLGADPGPA